MLIQKDFQAIFEHANGKIKCWTPAYQISKNNFVSVQKSTNTNLSMMKPNKYHRI